MGSPVVCLCKQLQFFCNFCVSNCKFSAILGAGPQVKKADIKRMVADVDGDPSGAIKFDSFVAMMTGKMVRRVWGCAPQTQTRRCGGVAVCGSGTGSVERGCVPAGARSAVRCARLRWMRGRARA